MNQNKRWMQGPRGHWLLGCARDFAYHTLKLLQEMRATGPMVKFRVGRYSMHFVSDPVAIGEVLLHQHQSFRKHQVFWRHFTDLFGNGLVTNEGDSWKKQRKMAAPSFQPKQLARYAEVMSARAVRFAQTIQDGEIRDVHEDMMALTAEIACETLFGIEFTAKPALRDAIKTFEEQISIRIARPFLFLDRLPLLSNLRYWNALNVIERAVREILDAHRREPQPHTLLGALMTARDEAGQPLSDKQLRDEAITMFLAGHETTALTMTWSLYVLARHPDELKRLRSEWLEVLGDRAPAWADLPKLTWTRRFVREVLRLYPPAYLIGRETTQAVRIDGYHLRAGASVLISPFVLGRDPTYFKNPEAFDSSRWTPEFESSLPRFLFIPFGGGPRVCIGEHFALAEVMMILCQFCRAIDVTYLEPEPPQFYETITLHPRGGLKLRCNRVVSPPLPETLAPGETATGER